MLTTIRSYLDLKNGSSFRRNESMDDSDEYDDGSDDYEGDDDDDDGEVRGKRLVNLPPEILLHIASFTSKRSDPRRERGGLHPLANSDMSSLATASRSLRAVLLPMLFSHVQVTSPKRLVSLSQAFAHIFPLIRKLSILVDLDFYDCWIRSLDAFMGTSDLAGNMPPFHATSSANSATPSTQFLVECLAQVLLQVRPTLQSLAFSMSAPRSSYSGSAWSQFPKTGMCGIPFSRPVTEALKEGSSLPGSSSKPVVDFDPLDIFPRLTSLYLDGTSDVGHLLPLTPNLGTLRLRIPEGFNAIECCSVIDSLHHVRKLEVLEMWIWEFVTQANPDGVKVANTHSISEVSDVPTSEPISGESREGAGVIKTPGVSLLEKIGISCPCLRVLSFQARSFDYADGSMKLKPISRRAFDWQDFLSVLQYFPELVQLHLPNSLFGRQERRLLNANRRIGSSYHSSSIMPGFSEPQPSMALRDVLSSHTPYSHQAESSTGSSSDHNGRGRSGSRTSELASSSDMTILEVFELVRRREQLASQEMITSSLQAGGRLSRISWIRNEDENTVAEYEATFTSTASPDPSTWTLLQVQLSDTPHNCSSDEYAAHLYDEDVYDYYIYDRYETRSKPISTSLLQIYSIFSFRPSSNLGSSFFNNKFLSRILTSTSSQAKPDTLSTLSKTKRGRHHRHSSSTSTVCPAQKQPRRLRPRSCSPNTEQHSKPVEQEKHVVEHPVREPNVRDAVAISRRIFQIIILFRLTFHISIPGYLAYLLLKRL
ncbi:hypothetical protein FRC02_006550 [Tulasnella sp. 418]|nr:hypothetical protein FRC02_006550 [Tulasnella sp. 418]